MARQYQRWTDAPIWGKIGRNIRDSRKWKNKTPEFVASKAGIELKRYKRIEKAIVKDITHDETFRIAKALKIDDELVTYH